MIPTAGKDRTEMLKIWKDELDDDLFEAIAGHRLGKVTRIKLYGKVKFE